MPEPAPEGKRIDEILIAAEEIVAESDPYPQLMNWVHVRTRDPVIRREVLLQEGELYDPARVAETERNLRRLAFIAVARVVAVQGRSPGTVALLVVTKDLWSIRLNSELAMVGSLLQRLRVRPSETNFLGLGQQLSADLWLKLDVLQVGQSYTDRRLLGSRLTLSESGALIFNRETGRLEGSRGAVGFGLPLTSLEQRWGYTIAGELAAPDLAHLPRRGHLAAPVPRRRPRPLRLRRRGARRERARHALVRQRLQARALRRRGRLSPPLRASRRPHRGASARSCSRAISPGARPRPTSPRSPASTSPGTRGCATSRRSG